MNHDNPYYDTLEIGIDSYHAGPGGNTDLGKMVLAAVENTRQGRRTRVVFHGKPLAVIAPDRRTGPDVLEVVVKGATLPFLRAAATARARELYGEDAELRIEKASQIHALTGSGFSCTFSVRCLNFPAEAL